MKERAKKIFSWFFAIDMFNIAIAGFLVWMVQAMAPYLFGDKWIPVIGMGFIPRALASVAAATILIWGGWFIYKVVMASAANYFIDDFKKDIMKIRKGCEPREYLRPVFFIALYFLWQHVIIEIAKANLF